MTHTYKSIYISLYISIYLSNLSIYLSIYVFYMLKCWLVRNGSICWDTHRNGQPESQRNARLPSCWNRCRTPCCCKPPTSNTLRCCPTSRSTWVHVGMWFLWKKYGWGWTVLKWTPDFLPNGVQDSFLTKGASFLMAIVVECLTEKVLVDFEVFTTPVSPSLSVGETSCGFSR